MECQQGAEALRETSVVVPLHHNCEEKLWNSDLNSSFKKRHLQITF